MTSSRILPPLSPFSPITLREYILLQAPCLDVKRFQFMPMDCKRNCVYDTRNSVDRLSVVGGWVERWMHWGVRKAALRRDVATSVDIPFHTLYKRRGSSECSGVDRAKCSGAN